MNPEQLKGMSEKDLKMMGIKPEKPQHSPEDIKKAQDTVTAEIVSYLKGEAPLRVELSDQEQSLLGKMRGVVRQQMETNPDATSLNLDFSKNPEAHQIWTNLVNRLAEPMLGKAPEPQTEQDKKANDIQKGFEGITEAFKASAEQKKNEYKDRIQAAINGAELKSGDIQYLEAMKQDYLRLGGVKFWE